MKNNKKLMVQILAGILAAILLLSLLAGLIPAASAASSSELKKQINELKEQQKEQQKQIDSLQDQIDDNMGEMEKLVAQKSIIDQEVFLLNEQIANINDQIQVYGLLIADKQDELDAARARHQELTDKNRERIRAMEEEGGLSYWSVLFKASSFADLLDRLNMIEEIAAADRRRLKELSAAAEEVALARENLELEKGELELVKSDLGAKQIELEGKRAEADELLSKLVAKGEEYELMLENAEDQAEELLQSIAQAEKEYTEAKKKEYQQWLSTSVPETKKPTTSKPGKYDPPESVTNGITWTMPVKYTRLTSPYGWRTHPVYGTRKFHSGVDLAAPKGTPIYASRSGTVTTAAYNSSGGYYVVINHGDGFSTGYLHMTHYIVKEGQRVSAGQVIGYVGSTGVSTGNHLHFSISYNGNSVNPANYIKFY